MGSVLRRAHEGLLFAAAATADAAQLQQAWKQVAASVGDDVDTELREVYERLVRQSANGASPSAHNVNGAPGKNQSLANVN
jgi:hypothetical protein